MSWDFQCGKQSGKPFGEYRCDGNYELNYSQCDNNDQSTIIKSREQDNFTDHITSCRANFPSIHQKQKFAYIKPLKQELSQT